MLHKVELKIHELGDTYTNIKTACQKSSALSRQLAEIFRLKEIDKKNKRNEGIKQREFDERQKKYERNMEKLKRMDRVEKVIHRKTAMSRSPPPKMRKLVKRREMTQDERDYMRYVDE